MRMMYAYYVVAQFPLIGQSGYTQISAEIFLREPLTSTGQIREITAYMSDLQKSQYPSVRAEDAGIITFYSHLRTEELADD